MKVSKIMTENVGVCGPNDSIQMAVGVMWERDCGIVPVVAKDSVIGVVTDRDIAVFLASQKRLPEQIALSEMIGGKVVTCRKKDSVKRALKKMSEASVRRLPVVGKKGELKGMISIADILSASKKDKDIRKRAIKTLTKLSRPRKIVFAEKAMPES